MAIAWSSWRLRRRPRHDWSSSSANESDHRTWPHGSTFLWTSGMPLLLTDSDHHRRLWKRSLKMIKARLASLLYSIRILLTSKWWWLHNALLIINLPLLGQLRRELAGDILWAHHHLAIALAVFLFHGCTHLALIDARPPTILWLRQLFVSLAHTLLAIAKSLVPRTRLAFVKQQVGQHLRRWVTSFHCVGHTMLGQVHVCVLHLSLIDFYNLLARWN